VNNIEAAVLGLVQGITEFLPISSTAHLRIVPALMGWPDPGAAFTAVLQLGTLAAVILFFARDLGAMARAGLGAITNREKRRDPNARLLGHVIVGTLPVVAIGVLLRKAIKGELRALPVIAAAMIGVGIVLAIVERVARHERDIERMTMRDAIIIGCAQALALIPGVSRSGITMAAAMAIESSAPARFWPSSWPLLAQVRGEGDFTSKVLSAMRFQFGGHVETPRGGH